MRLKASVTGDEANDDDVVEFLNWVSFEIQHITNRIASDKRKDKFSLHCLVVSWITIFEENPSFGIILSHG